MEENTYTILVKGTDVAYVHQSGHIKEKADYIAKLLNGNLDGDTRAIVVPDDDPEIAEIRANQPTLYREPTRHISTNNVEILVKVAGPDIDRELALGPIVEMTQPGWNTLSCKRRISEYCDERGWEMLEDGIKTAHSLYDRYEQNSQVTITAKEYARLKILLPWVASVVHYGKYGRNQ